MAGCRKNQPRSIPQLLQGSRDVTCRTVKKRSRFKDTSLLPFYQTNATYPPFPLRSKTRDAMRGTLRVQMSRKVFFVCLCLKCSCASGSMWFD